MKKDPGVWFRGLLLSCRGSDEILANNRRSRSKLRRNGYANALLLELRRNAFEFGVEAGAQPVDDGDDGYRNSRCDQAILDGGRAGLIFEKTKQQSTHNDIAPVARWARVDILLDVSEKCATSAARVPV
jgi:hypothetical protein